MDPIQWIAQEDGDDGGDEGEVPKSIQDGGGRASHTTTDDSPSPFWLSFFNIKKTKTKINDVNVYAYVFSN